MAAVDAAEVSINRGVIYINLFHYLREEKLRIFDLMAVFGNNELSLVCLAVPDKAGMISRNLFHSRSTLPDWEWIV